MQAASRSTPPLLENEDIVCFGSGEWYYAPSIPEHTMTVLARTNRILYVEPFVSIFTVLRSVIREGKKCRIRIGLRQVGPRMYVYSPPPIALPLQHHVPFCLTVNTALLVWLVKKVMRIVQFSNPIVWLYLFRLHGLVGKFSQKATVYDCMEHEEFFVKSPYSKHRVRTLEETLCRKVDAVFVLNSRLLEKIRPWNAETVLCPSGANFSHFYAATSDDTPLPPDLERLPRPIIGYMGQIDPWKMDMALIKFLAQYRGDWSIVLVGYTFNLDKDRDLRRVPNLHILGPQPYDALPACLKGFDVCIMPFLLTEAQLHADPLKLYEYLAAGKPIVSTAIPAAYRFPELVWVGHDYHEFASLAEKAVHAYTDELIAKRITVARQNSWEHRVAIKSQVVQRRMRSHPS